MEAVQLHGGNGYMSEYPVDGAARNEYSRGTNSPGTFIHARARAI